MLILILYLFIESQDFPEIVSVQLWLHIFPSVVGNERHLKRVLLHEIQGLLDLGDSGLLWLATVDSPWCTRPAVPVS